MDVYELVACPTCMDKSFDKHYNMVNATWASKGLNKLPNSICCEEHFKWHEMNCQSAYNADPIVQKIHLETDQYNGQLSENFF
jgi:hypothetical protein